MYRNGELKMVMESFEKTLKTVPVYIGGAVDRADKFAVDTGDGRTENRYRSNNYYNNGNVNQLFLLYLNGYACGKCEARQE